MNKCELMKKNQEINLLEKDLMRDLTQEEMRLVLNDGFKSLFKKLNISDDDYKAIRISKDILGNYFTGDCTQYKEAIKKAQNIELVKDTFKNIVDDLNQKQETSECKSILDQYKELVNIPTDSIDYYITILKSGKELELDQDTINQIVEKLWNTESNVKISIVNNKIKVS